MQDLDRLVGFAGGDVTSFSRTCSCKLLALDVDLADSWHGKRLIGRNSGERGGYLVKCGYQKICATNRDWLLV